MSPIRVSVNNQQSLFAIDEPLLAKAVRQVLQAYEITNGEVSIAIVSDPQIHELNREHLDHDYPTDVLSFLYEHRADDHYLDGELVVSTDTARRVGAENEMQEHDELMLYVVHGSLHLVGLDDHRSEDVAKMRAAERQQMLALGVELPKSMGKSKNPENRTESLS